MKKLILLLFLFVSFISSAQIYSTYFVIPRTTGGVIHVTVDVVGLYNKCYDNYAHHGYYYNVYATSETPFNVSGNFYFHTDSINTYNGSTFNSVVFNSGASTFVSLNNQLSFNNTLDDKYPNLCEGSGLSRFTPVYLKVNFWGYGANNSGSHKGDYYFEESKPLGIQDSINVYPTIINNEITVESDVVVIQSMLGEFLDVIKLENGKGKVSLLNYPAGVYLINGKRVIKI